MPGSHRTGGVTEARDSSRIVGAKGVVEARIGTLLRVGFRGGEVLLDGPAAVRLTHGDGALPRLEILRGRVVASATDRGSLHVVAGAERIEVWEGQPFRWHDRVVYHRDGGGWRKERLYP